MFFIFFETCVLLGAEPKPCCKAAFVFCRCFIAARTLGRCSHAFDRVKSHAELAELAKHLAQADRSEADYAVFQSCLERLTKDNVIYDAAAEEF